MRFLNSCDGAKRNSQKKNPPELHFHTARANLES
jgi:hypothetical protein